MTVEERTRQLQQRLENYNLAKFIEEIKPYIPALEETAA